MALSVALIATPVAEMPAGPWTILSKAGKLGKAGKAPKVNPPGPSGSSGKVGTSAAGVAGSAVLNPEHFAGNPLLMRRALTDVEHRAARGLAELDELGFHGVAAKLRRAPVPWSATQLYIGRLDGSYYFVKAKGSEVLYGKLPGGSSAAAKAVLGDAADTGRSRIILEPEAVDDGLIDDDLLDAGLDIRIVRDTRRTWATRVIKNEKRELSVIYSPTVHVKVSSKVSLADLRNFDTRSFSKSNVRILSHFDETADLDSVRRLADVGKRSDVDFVNIDETTIAREFEEHSGKTMTMVGHVESEAFVAYAADGTVVSRIPLKRIQELADLHDNHVLFLGCSTAQSPGAAGYLRKVQSFDVARRLQRALRAKKVGEFYSALGTRDNPIVVTELAISGNEGNLTGIRLVGTAALRGQPNGLQVRSVGPNPFWWMWYWLAAAACFWTSFGLYKWGMGWYALFQLRKSRRDLAQAQ